MVAVADSAPQATSSAASKAVLADLIRVAKQHLNPDRRLEALEMLVLHMDDQPVVNFMVDRLRNERDISILWQCLGWLLQRYLERGRAEKAILARLEREPDPALRRDILDMVSLRLGASDSVERTVARMADADPEFDLRALAAATLIELRHLRYSPPPPAPVSHSSRLLDDWAAVETAHRRSSH
jgi:hypothetical protein